MNDFANMFVNYGSLGIVTAYFIYKDYTVSRQMLDVLTFIKAYICSLKGDEDNE